ncbi:MAG: HD domain-containing protein [Chitinophagaceae bacterium]
MPIPKLVDQTAIYVAELYKKYQTPDLFYHNLEHTQNVVKRTKEIAANYSFDETELFILVAAAWFHDTGYLFGVAKQHEERSVSIMQKYLEAKCVEKKIIDIIKGCILATKLSQNPTSLLEEIICDADTYNLGTEDFFKTDRLLKKEFELRNNASPDNWDKQTLELLEKHKYFTSCCRDKLEKGKQKNIEVMRTLLNK